MCYRCECRSVGFHPQSGAYHRDAEGYLSRYYDTPRDVTNHRFCKASRVFVPPPPATNASLGTAAAAAELCVTNAGTAVLQVTGSCVVEHSWLLNQAEQEGRGLETRSELKIKNHHQHNEIGVSQCDAGCSEVDSLTEAVAGEGFLLGCISCKRREEVPARATVDWHFKPLGEEEFRHIFHYDHPVADILHEDFSDRLVWRGTLNDDIQMGTVYVNNVTFNDTGTYRCTFHRTLFLPLSPELVTVEKEVELSVVTVANRELTDVISEIMMYVLITFLQLWLIVVLIYCYKKIWDEHEARQAKKAQAGQGESKDNCDGVQLD
ncbi:sodium channel subunit beta-1 [Pelmatolapia mariae]|uniref:sodium channel subunit beta-1 n=1 Tax=Pelmatolapia mariae TaxID=158779 RepID=UPI002FE64C9B